MEVVEMAELRLGSRSFSFAIWETRLCSGELGWPWRTASEPLAVRDSLCGRSEGEEVAALENFGGTRVIGEEFALLATSLRGCRFGTMRLPRYRSAMGRRCGRELMDMHAFGEYSILVRTMSWTGKWNVRDTTVVPRDIR